MQTGTDRKRKYDSKTSGAQAKLRVDADRKREVSNYKHIAISQEQLERTVKGICKNVATALTQVYYICFGNEIERIKSKHSGATLCNEIRLMYDKWAARGLNATTLNEIILHLAQGCSIPPIFTFRLDISLLDGPDVLS